MIKSKVDVSAIDEEITALEGRQQHFDNIKSDILSDMNSLDVSDKHYSRKKEDLQKRLYDIYDSLDELEAALNEARKKRHSIAERKTSADNVYKSLIYFDKLIDKLNEEERRTIIEQLVSKVEIYPEKQLNGQWLKSIEFKLLIIKKEMKIFLDNGSQAETVVLMGKTVTRSKSHVDLGLDVEDYYKIKDAEKGQE
ncbi:hypothetical protein [Pseudobutyrivibrio sp. ACV-2]|uniref:hypothetical protein n=1 Tax=Pseudobutyrivibrio sp. ACV-2 TaxID=1520801 RepID=UPI000B7DEFC3|nr:hypothetical protein [Pseudobutyrivibrio sp. ACV-2]